MKVYRSLGSLTQLALQTDGLVDMPVPKLPCVESGGEGTDYLPKVILSHIIKNGAQDLGIFITIII